MTSTRPRQSLPDAVHDLDFIELLDAKLRRRNGRLIEKLLAWGGLLDAAGWSVALNGVGGELWLSEKAGQEAQRLGRMPSTWSDLVAMLDGISEEFIVRQHDGVIIWAAQLPARQAAGPLPQLTRRETEVMAWLRDGKTSPEIAIILGCSARTVEKHVANLYRKTGVRHRAAMILSNRKP